MKRLYTKINIICEIKKKKMFYVHMNIPGSPRKSHVPYA